MRLGRTSVTIIYYFHKDEISPRATLGRNDLKLDYLQAKLGHFDCNAVEMTRRTAKPSLIFTRMRFLRVGRNDITYVMLLVVGDMGL